MATVKIDLHLAENAIRSVRNNLGTSDDEQSLLAPRICIF